MTRHKPVGFAALLERMPPRFVSRFKRVEERARLRRKAQARRLELEFLCGVEVKDSAWEEWHDTVAGFNGKAGDEHGTA